VQPLIVGQDDLRVAAEKVAVPDRHQPESRRQVFGQRRTAEVAIDRVAPRQELLEARAADGKFDGQADR